MNPLDEKTARQILEWAKWYADRINIKSHAFDRDDLIGVGVLAAVEAIPRWNPQRSKLITFLGHRIKGALRDYIRRYVNGRRKTEGYCDHTVERFGDIQGSWEDKVSSGAFDDRKSLDDAMEGPNLDGTSAFEAMEFLEHWRHCMSERDYRILFLRYGGG
jgi:RNA polymerase sigma factor (sigma-70 family)